MKSTDIKILIVDDEASARYGMRRALQRSGYHLYEAENGKDALQQMQKVSPEIILCDINMPEMSGLEFLKKIQEKTGGGNARPLTIVITAYGSEKIAVEAMKAGAYDYLSKPYDIDELRLLIQRAIDKLSLEWENRRLRQQLDISTAVEIVGESDAIKRVKSLIAKVAPTDVTVLLTGESGTGKELVARTIHKQSPRRDGPFITMNCAAIPRDLVESELFGHEKGAFTGATEKRQGKFELADGGTLFLDEIADMSLETQAKILRVLEDKTFTRLGGKEIIRTDVRLVSASNKNLPHEIKEGTFRQDLYFRLKVVELELPRLAERRDDILLLADHFLRLFSEKHHRNLKKIDARAARLLQQYEWPGNVRQLMHVIEQSVVLADEECLRAEHLPPEITADQSRAEFGLNLGNLSFREEKERAVKMIEREIIEKALQNSNGNVSQAARELQMKRQFLQQKMSKLEIRAAKFRRENG